MSLDLNTSSEYVLVNSTTDYYLNKQLHVQCSTIRIMLFRNSRQFIIESSILSCDLLFCYCSVKCFCDALSFTVMQIKLIVVVII